MKLLLAASISFFSSIPPNTLSGTERTVLFSRPSFPVCRTGPSAYLTQLKDLWSRVEYCKNGNIWEYFYNLEWRKLKVTLFNGSCGQLYHLPWSRAAVLFQQHFSFHHKGWLFFLTFSVLSPPPSSIIICSVSFCSSSSLRVRDKVPVLILINYRIHLTFSLFLWSSFSGPINIWTCSQKSQWRCKY